MSDFVWGGGTLESEPPPPPQPTPPTSIPQPQPQPHPQPEISAKTKKRHFAFLRKLCKRKAPNNKNNKNTKGEQVSQHNYIIIWTINICLIPIKSKTFELVIFLENFSFLNFSFLNLTKKNCIDNFEINLKKSILKSKLKHKVAIYRIY